MFVIVSECVILNLIGYTNKKPSVVLITLVHDIRTIVCMKSHVTYKTCLMRWYKMFAEKK